MEKIITHFKKYGEYYAVPLVILFLWGTLLAVFDSWPFGSNTFSSYDTFAQVVPFMEHFFDVFDGNASLFFNYAVAGGADVFGTLAYCAVSPFTFLFLVLGKGNVLYATNIVIAAKLMAVGFTGVFFIRRMFPTTNRYVGAIMGILYAYSGYFYHSSTYPNWLDYLIYMPLLIMAFNYFRKTEKIRYFSAMLAVCMYACFGLGSFSMLVFFMIFMIYPLVVVEKADRKRIATKIILAFVIAVAAAMPILVPGFMAYLNSSRKTDYFYWIFEDFKYTHMYSTLTYILCDVLFVLTSLIFFTRCDKKNKLNVFLIIASVIIFLPAILHRSILLLNGGSYYSYALRFGFMNTAMSFLLSCMVLKDFSIDNKTEQVAKSKEIISTTVMTILVTLLAIGTIWLAKNENRITEFLNNTFIKIDESVSDHSCFAHSIGMLDIIVILFVMLSAVFMVGWVFWKKGHMTARVFAFFMTFVAVCQVGFCSYNVVWGNNFNPINSTALTDMLDEQNIDSDELYHSRIKDYNALFSGNFQMIAHSGSYSVFSSAVDSMHFTVPEVLGYDKTSNSMRSYSGSLIADCMLGYKYFYTNVKLDYGSYPEFMTELGKVELSESDGRYLYQNELVFPSAFTIYSPVFNESASSYETQKELYAFLSDYDDKSPTIVDENGNSRTYGVNTPTALEKLRNQLLEREVEINYSKNGITADFDNTGSSYKYLFIPNTALKGYTVKVNGLKTEFVDNAFDLMIIELDDGINKIDVQYSSPYVKYIMYGALIGTIILAIVIFLIYYYDKFLKYLEGTLFVMGVVLAGAMILFFYVFPLVVGVWKLVEFIQKSFTKTE